MPNKCKNCGKEPKKDSKHTAYTSEYRIWCPDCMEMTISDKSMWSATVEWNKKNPKVKK